MFAITSLLRSSKKSIISAGVAKLSKIAKTSIVIGMILEIY